MQRTGHSPTVGLSATDRTLLSGARDGDARAFDPIIVSRLPRAYRLAEGILGDRDAAAEATLNALVAAWHELPKLEELDRFDDWLDRILLRECHMRLAQAGTARPDGGVPGDLHDRAVQAIAGQHQAGSAEGTRRTGPDRRGRNLLRWGLAAMIPLLAVALLATADLPFWPTDAASGPSASDEGAGPETSAGAAGPSGTPDPGSATPPGTGGVTPDRLTPGGLAIVTRAGEDLRVRSAPGTDEASRLLKPLLPAGTRMLLVAGPIARNGYDWYQVQTDGEPIDLFGWVAAAKDGKPWIAPVWPQCRGGASAESVAWLNRIDFLACYGAAKVKVKANAGGLWDPPEEDEGCGWVRKRGACDADVRWLLLPSGRITLVTESGAEHDITVAVPPDLLKALRKVPRQSTLLMTLSMDAPESESCAIRDKATRKPLLSKGEAITACRLQFVVQELAFRDPGAVAPPSPSIPPD